MKQLTKDQIQTLFDFTKSHRVRYYDLQSEVVDHLASAIEHKWEKNPNLPFQTALNQVYTNFGIYGFGKLEQEKREAIQKKIGWKVWAFVKTYLTIPKVGLTLLLIILTNLVLSILPNPLDISVGLIFFGLAGFSIGIHRQRMKNRPVLNRFLEVHSVLTGGNLFMLLFIFPLELFIFGDHSAFPLWIVSIVLVFFALTLLGTYQYCVKTVEEVKLRYG